MLSEGKRAGETTRLHSGCRTLWAPSATSSLLLGRPLPALFGLPHLRTPCQELMGPREAGLLAPVWKTRPIFYPPRKMSADDQAPGGSSHSGAALPAGGLKVLVGLTGSVATIKAGELVEALQRSGCQVQCVATAAATHFLKDQWALGPS